MGYAILRTQKLKSGISFKRSVAHAFRDHNTPNADPTRTAENSHFGAVDAREALSKFNARLATQTKIRSNAVLAIEYLVTASPDDMRGKSREAQDNYFADALKWLEAKHGAENVVCAGVHRDETTPHMYAYVVPIDARGKLNCREFLGGAKALNLMQTDFAEAVGKAHGLQRGIEGSKAHHTTVKQYYARAAAAFEPLPEVVTPAPGPAQPKPGLFSGRKKHEEWERVEQQRQQHMSEVKAQQDAAVEIARRHQAQASEAAASKAASLELKKSNSIYSRGVLSLSASNRELKADLLLFTPAEIEAARQRQTAEIKRQEELATARAALAEREKAVAAEQARAAAEARALAAHQQRVAAEAEAKLQEEQVRAAAEREKAAAEVAKAAAEAERVELAQATAEREKLAAEAVRRVAALERDKKLSSGADYTFIHKSLDALSAAGGDSERVDWRAIERLTVAEAIGDNGQPRQEVMQAIIDRSPLRVDPASHAEIREYVVGEAPRLEERYQRDRDGPSNNNDFSPLV